jgi:hypothetical protein
MRLSSSRVATAAALVAVLAVLVVAGRLLPTIPSADRSTTPSSVEVPAGTVRSIPPQDVPTSTIVGAVRVPNAIGHTLTRATRLMRTAGLRGVAAEHDLQSAAAVVFAQEPPAGVLVPSRSVVGFRTSTDVQANGSPRRVRLGRGPTTATYPVMAPDPARQRLTVVVTMPAAVELQVWLATAGIRRVPILDTNSGTASCHRTGGRSRCVVGVGALDDGTPGCGPPPLPSSRPRQRRSRSRSPSRPADLAPDDKQAGTRGEEPPAGPPHPGPLHPQVPGQHPFGKPELAGFRR